MAITDIQISEELETNAPSIKYSGNEGPKSPQEEQMMMADAILEEEYNKYVFDLLEIRPEATPMTIEEFRQMVIAEGQMSGGQPLPQDPTKPVNPFQPKPQGPTLPNRQMAAYGGIMGLDGRRQYGIGSSLKKFVRKVIPNEVSEVAVKAAPFVAPFNPQLAAAMAGIGGFDQTGRIGSSLKNAAITYGLGQLGRQIGGAGFQDPSMSLQGFTNLSSPTTGASIFGGFGGPKAAPSEFLRPNIGDVSRQKSITPTNLNDYVGTTKPDLGGIYSADNVTQKGIADLAKYPVTDPASVNKASGLSRFLTKAKEYVPTSFGDLKDPKKLLGAIGISSALAAASGMGTAEETVSEIMDRGDGLDIDSIRLEVREAFKDSSGQKLAALRNKYPYLGTQASKDIANMAMGGRIGRAEGGLMDLGGMEKDYRAEGGFVPIGREEKADDVPARLSVNEFVFTADAVRNAGGGDIDKGAEVMENMMKNLEAGGQVSEESQGIQSLRAGGRAGFANGLRVDTDKVIEDIRKFSIPGLIGRGVKTGADKISDIDLETIIKVVAKTAPGGMVVEKVTEFLVDRYGMTEDEAQMRIVNKLGTDANEGFKNPSGTSDEGYRMVGIESSAEDTSDIPRRNRLKNLLGRAPSIEMPKLKPPFDFDNVKPVPMPGSEKPPLSPDATNLNPHQDINPLQTMEFRDRNGNGIEDRAEGIYYDRDLIPYDPNRNKRFLPRPSRKNRLEEMFNTSERLSEVIG